MNSSNKMKISGGAEENGVVVGNAYDKYGSGNPIVQHIMRGFEESLEALVVRASPEDIHEVGCGEGYWVMKWHEQGIPVRGSDFSQKVIDIASRNASSRGLGADLFARRSIYDLDPGSDHANLVVCCEVLEHIDDPEKALKALHRVADPYLIVSVPREPLWRGLNMMRGRYIGSLGNTPGHIQHWSSSGIKKLVGRHFEIVEVRRPLPWTMLLARAKS